MAKQQNTSTAELVRRAVDDWLARHGCAGRQTRRERAPDVVGRYRSSVGGVAGKHGEGLAEGRGDYEPR